jgi:hypothetical protein
MFVPFVMVCSLNNANIKSDHLNISSVQDSKATQMKSSTKGLFSSSVSLSTKATANNIASNLTTNNLTIKTTKEDINITGSNIDAQLLDVDVFGSATDAIVCLDVNACCVNVVVGIKGDVVATEC